MNRQLHHSAKSCLFILPITKKEQKNFYTVRYTTCVSGCEDRLILPFCDFFYPSNDVTEKLGGKDFSISISIDKVNYYCL